METLNTDKLYYLRELFTNWAGEQPLSITAMPRSGSSREYYRISGHARKAIGVYNDNYKENLAFVKFTEHFLAHGLPVPELYKTDLPNHIYLLEDLGDITLFDYLKGEREEYGFTENLKAIYKQVIEELPRFQVKAGANIDYRYCYPRSAFDKQSMHWDMNYFKYYFLRLAHIPFDEQALEDDFEKLSDYLTDADSEYFLYRDFQSRNIMLKDNRPYFIDYQGGRKGALQYDLASLLYDAKAAIPQNIRNELLEHYISTLKQYIRFDEQSFRNYFLGYVLIRIMQALGAYGFRGFYERKEHFLQSIPYALSNLKYLLSNYTLPVEIPELQNSLEQLVKSEKLWRLGKSAANLTVTVVSFSYRKGYPVDHTGNGGGHIFDCRAVTNPGKQEAFIDMTGKAPQVQQFLDKESEMQELLKHSYAIVAQSVNTYIKRNFSHLMVGFGCTGGQHRSVYAAERMAKYLNDNFEINVNLHHREQTI